MSFFKNHILLRKSKFLPNKIPNLGMWLESDYGITKDGSNAVSEWVGRGSRGYTISQATGANQPIWTQNEFGSQAGLIFDGTNDSLDRTVSNPFGDVQNFSCFIVAKATTANAAQNYLFMADLATSDNYFGFFKGGETQSSALITNGRSGTDNFVYGNTALNNNLPFLAISESDGSAWAERVNRTNQSLTVTGTNTGQAPGDHITLDNIVLSALKRNTNTFVVSNFAAILFYERQLSIAERTRVEDYLINKYGIAA